MIRRDHRRSITKASSYKVQVSVRCRLLPVRAPHRLHHEAQGESIARYDVPSLLPSSRRGLPTALDELIPRITSTDSRLDRYELRGNDTLINQAYATRATIPKLPPPRTFHGPLQNVGADGRVGVGWRAPPLVFTRTKGPSRMMFSLRRTMISPGTVVAVPLGQCITCWLALDDFSSARRRLLHAAHGNRGHKPG